MRVLALSLALLALSCSKEPNRWEAAEKAANTPGQPAAEQPEKVEGSKLNAIFPSKGPDGASRVFTAEKDGYAEAKLVSADGTDLALLSIAVAAPDALAKFDAAKDQVASYPLVTVGSNQSSVLVNKKYQVKVSSKTLDAAARKSVLSNFHLKELAQL